MVSPGSAARIAFWMDSPGPTTELCAPAEPIPTASATPLATNRVRAMVLNINMVRLIGRASFLVFAGYCEGLNSSERYSPGRKGLSVSGGGEPLLPRVLSLFLGLLHRRRSAPAQPR